MSTSRGRTFPPIPEILPRTCPDSHTHLDLTIERPGFDELAPRGGPAAGDDESRGGLGRVAALLDRSAAAGIDRVVQIGIDLQTSRWSIAAATRYPAVVATVAVHPNTAAHLPDLDAALDEIDRLADHPRVRGIGETGLDYFRTGDAGHAAQHGSFLGHIDIAKRHGKALIIHDRDAHDDVLRLLEVAGAPETVVFHCFSGDEDFARRCVERGYVLSFAGNVTFQNAEALRAAARITPPGQLLVETDAPFLTPAPHRGQPNASYLVPLIVRALAEIRDVPVEELCTDLSATAERVFGQW